MSQQHIIEFRCSFTRTITSAALITGKDYILGSSPGSDLVLQGQDIAEQHATLILSSDGLYITPIAKAIVSVNGHTFIEETALADGDWLSVGSSLFQINFPDHPAFAKPHPVTSQDKPSVLTIGRIPECDFAIASPMVSREHAKLYCDQKDRH